MKKTKLFKVISIAVFLISCESGNKREPCPTVEEEPVSTCRAMENCRSARSSVGLGLGIGIGRNVGIGISQSHSTDDYTYCIDRDLKSQEAKNKEEIESKSPKSEQPGQKPGLNQ